MYQADFICTYKWMDNENDQEQMYRIQMLQAFDLNAWDDSIIHSIINELYAKLSNLAEFKDIFAKARENKHIQEIMALIDEDTNDIIFNLLFKFEYFDLLHRCIVDFLVNNTLSPKYVTNLLNGLL